MSLTNSGAGRPRPTAEEIERAARIIREGGLVAFPTETVYGLGANALNAAAVARIFSAKGRPSTSPLIVHVASVEEARAVTATWPRKAGQLAERFWPGPLTLVLPKGSRIPDIVTAGLATVGVRIPSHPVALELIRRAGVPVAAPSANPFTRVSPTEAAHVTAALSSEVDLVLDAGPSPVGIESTVLSLAGEAPLLLRPGMVSQAEIEAVIGAVGLAGEADGPHPSPGMHRQHYAPRTKLRFVSDGKLPAGGRGAYLWIRHPAPAARGIQMPSDPAGYAARLYAVLHELDREEWDWIAVEPPPATPEWAAILDRLTRAAEKNRKK